MLSLQLFNCQQAHVPPYCHTRKEADDDLLGSEPPLLFDRGGIKGASFREAKMMFVL